MTTLSESQRRLFDKLYQDLGQKIQAWLRDDDVNEIMRNPDGSLWLDQISCGQHAVGYLSNSDVTSILNSVAGIHGLVITSTSPWIEALLPFYQEMRGERVTGCIPPMVSAPCLSIRKRT